MPGSRTFRLRTNRLTIRPLARDDVTAFTDYRNLPDVARYQDWPMPYTRDLAHELVDEMDRLGGPTPGGWVQLALDTADAFIGDVAVWLDDAGSFAMVGYTLAPRHQGHGYAAEAVEAVVEWLFRRRKVHRVAATIDPRNVASARVLERCGFGYIGTAPSAALVRGEWLDDARFSLLRPDWEAWQARPTDPPQSVQLVPVSRANLRRVGEIEVAFSQRNFVAPVLWSLAEALIPPDDDGETVTPWYRAVVADGAVAGFLMIAEPTTTTPHPYLWRYSIDRRHQGRGIGRRALELLIEQQRAAGHRKLLVSYVPDEPGNAGPFYAALGFVPTGKIDDGEVEAVVTLAG